MKKIMMSLIILSSFNLFSTSENLIRKISVTGNSEKEVMPDIAVINFLISEKDKDLNVATKKTKDALENFKKELGARKIQTGEIETISFYDTKKTEYEEDVKPKNLKNQKQKSEIKTPVSYTAEIEILVKNIDFNRLSGLIGVDSDKNFSKIEKNFLQNSYSVSLKETDKTVDAALNKLFVKVNDVKEKLQSVSDTKNDVIFGGYKITENFTNDSKTPVEMYYVNHNLKLTVKNLKNLNTIISIAADNDININGSIQFDLSNKDEIERQMYKQAFNEAEKKAKSILKSSVLKLGKPIIVSEDLDFQQKMIDKIDSQWEVKAVTNTAELSAPVAESYLEDRVNYYSTSKRAVNTKVDYTPKPLKLEQNVSVMYEIK